MPTQDFGSYLDPGIFVNELPSAVITPTGIAPTVIALVGDSQRFRVGVAVAQLNSTTNVALPDTVINLSSVIVTDRFTGVTYVNTTDYVLSASGGITSIHRTSGGSIANGTYVSVAYDFTAPGYFEPKTFLDYDDIKAQYGDPFAADGSINSPLTLGAYFAFLNGASEIVCVAINASGSDPTPTEWGTTINLLQGQVAPNTVVPLSGSTTVHDKALTFVSNMEALGQYYRAFVGQSGTISASAYITQATGLASKRMVVVGPSTIQFFQGDTNSYITLGAEYLAAAVAGMHAGLGVQVPLTRKQVRGFYSIPSQVTDSTMLSLQRAGVLWVWQRRNGTIVVRHGLTTDMATLYTREISIQASKDRLMVLVLETLENQGLVGSEFIETTPQFVLAAVSGALEQAKAANLIQSYSGLKYRQPTSNPTLLQVRFMYKPTLPLNYVLVEFSIDTNSGTVNLVDIGQVAA